MELLRKWLKALMLTLMGLAVVTLAFVAGYRAAVDLEPPVQWPPMPTPQPTPPSALRDSEFDVFSQVWHILQDEYYGDIVPSEATQGAIQGLLDALGDPYTFFVSPQQAPIVNSDITGVYEGIGSRVASDPDGRIVIIEVFDGSGAAEAGLRVGDVVLEADDTDLTGKTVDEAITFIRGPANTSVTLTIERDGQDAFDVSVARRRIEVPVVTSRMLLGGIAYLKLDEFNARASDLVASALTDLMAQQPQGLVLDLRGNPGGLLSSAIDVTSQFIDQSPILVEEFKEGFRQEYKARPDGLALTVPLVVLVDGGSASASEILAGALQDFGRATLVGEPTFGKGSVQLSHELADGSYLRVTAAHWLTPKGRQINGRGLMPDIIAPGAATGVPGSDAALDAAAELLRAGP